MMSALHGHPPAQYTLGRLYKGGKGVEASPEESMKWFIRSCENGNVNALYEIGSDLLSSEDASNNEKGFD